MPVLDDSGVCHVAIGGITAGNIDTVLHAGAQAVVVCSAVADSPDPKAACKKLKQTIDALLERN